MRRPSSTASVPWRAAIAATGLAACLLPTPAHAQLPQLGASTAPAPDADATREQTPDERREALQKAIVKAETTLLGEAAAGRGDGPTAQRLRRKIGLLKQLEVSAAQQASLAAGLGELEIARADAQAALESLRADGPSEDEPYSFLLLERLREELDAERAATASAEEAMTALVDELDRAKKTLERKQSLRRAAKETAETGTDPRAARAAAAELEAAELETDIARESVALRQRELERARLTAEIARLRVTFIEEKIETVGESAEFTQSDLDEQLFAIGHEEAKLEKEIEKVRANANYAERRFFEARAELDRASEPDRALTEELESHRLGLETLRQRLESLQKRRERLAEMRSAWTRRYEIASGAASAESTETWEDETARRVEGLEREARLLTTRSDEVHKAIAAVDAKLDTAEQTPAVATKVRAQREALGRLLEVHQSELASIAASRRLHEKLYEEVAGERRSFSLGRALSSAWRRTLMVWNFELTAIDDRPITVRKVIIGILLLAFGFGLARRISSTVAHRLLVRFGVAESAAHALQSIMFYALVVMFTLLALNFVNVPLTAFTILGGAFAIGIGFGSQNIMNNFISGLILLVERPVKVGDMIEIDGIYGNVVHIGPRSTRVKTGDNLEIIVPNSTFLENNVANWSLTDTRLRTRVAVGVAYGSPTEKVTELLLQAAAEHDRVFATPKPFVMFTDFGDNALGFELIFWLHSQSYTEILKVQSELRYAIDRLFGEADITIAFPQRDVHLDSLSPVEVRVVSDRRDP